MEECSKRFQYIRMKSEKIRKAFGSRVQFLRKQKNLTQEELAEQTDKSKDTISNIERGISSTTIENAMAIAYALGVAPADLFELPISNHANKSYSDHMRALLLLCADEDEEWLKAAIAQVKILKKLNK